jgi:hypothetical protein
MKISQIFVLLAAYMPTVALAAGSSNDPIERMASGALKVVVILVIVGAVTFFTKNKKK